MTRQAAAHSALAVFLLLAAACSDSTRPVKTSVQTTPLDSVAGLFVSQPVSGPGGASASVRGLRSSPLVGSSVVYVSLVPGAVPDGMQATIRDQVTGASVTTAVVNGGFDPVAIAADVGDTLVVEITRSGAVAPLRAMETVRANHPPVVVRTSPPRGGRDVPLNAAMVVVFSDPIDSGTLIPGAIQLWQDSTAVPGTVLFSDSLGLRAEFHPDSLLAWQTAYRFVVTRAIRDVNGMPLDSVVEVGFTTAITPPTTGLVFALVSVGHGHTCGVTTAGKTYCWGANNNGQFGDGTYDNIRGTPVPAAAGLPLTSVSAGLDATCGVTTDGAAYCWGPYWGITQGMFDSVAVANNCSPYGCPTPLPVPGGHTFKMVSFRVGHACGVTTDGAAYCWGTNESGQLGIDSATLVSNCRDASPGNGIGGCPTPLRVAGGLTFATVSTGEHHTCGLTTDGAAYCWGSNASGQLGAGTTFGPEQCGVAGSTFPCSRVPVAVIGGLSFTEISAGYNYTCGVVSTGAAYCWGYNAGGELGSGSTAGPQVCIYDPYNSAPCSPSPVPVAGGLVFRMISAGWDVTCGVTTGGAAYCWGWRNPGASAVPLPVSGGLTFALVSTVLLNTCGLTAGGVVYCWGANNTGQLGNGTFTDSWGVPVKVAGQAEGPAGAPTLGVVSDRPGKRRAP